MASEGPQWMQQSYYEDIPSNEVNWAALAQQWVAMRDGQEAAISNPPEAPQVAPPAMNAWPPFAPNQAHPMRPPLLQHPPPSTSDMPTGYEHYYTEELTSSAAHHAMAMSNHSSGSNSPHPHKPAHNASYQPNGSRDNRVDYRSFVYGSNAYGGHARTDGAADYDSSVAMMDMQRRKKLPAWIREGLEKMEREKMQAERQKAQKQREEEEGLKTVEKAATVDARGRVVSKFDSDSSDGEDDDDKTARMRRSRSRSRSRSAGRKTEKVVEMTEDERRAEAVSLVRQWMTQILMEVTNDEVECICETFVGSSQRAAAVSESETTSQVLARRSAALSSLQSLGAGAASSDSEEEDVPRKGNTENQNGETTPVVKNEGRTSATKQVMPEPERRSCSPPAAYRTDKKKSKESSQSRVRKSSPKRSKKEKEKKSKKKRRRKSSSSSTSSSSSSDRKRSKKRESSSKRRKRSRSPAKRSRRSRSRSRSPQRSSHKSSRRKRSRTPSKTRSRR